MKVGIYDTDDWDADWYNNQPVPDKLLRNLAELPVLSESLIQQDFRRRREPGKLSIRETEVINLLSHGLDEQTIAEELVLSKWTVKDHIRNARLALGAKTRAHIVAIALREEMIE